jgi:nicotinamidase-related amidase
MGSMNPWKADPERGVVIVVDLQPTFLAPIHEADRVLNRSQFLLKMARLVGVPVLASEQYPDRMGGTDQRIASLLPLGGAPYAKQCFSCGGCSGLMESLRSLKRKQAVLVGIETHICVTLTALDLLREGFEVFVCPDAVSARTVEMHKLGMERMRDSGAMPAHTETIAYEWMGSADHPRFREALQVVKEHAAVAL